MTAFRRRRRPGADGADGADGSEAFDRRLILPMILGAILNPINSTMLAVALVPIGIAFGAPASETAWLVTGLYLATAVGQPVVGRLIDLYGPRRLYLVGSVLIGVGGVLGTVAPSLGVLVVARVLIGFGTCAGYPAAMLLTAPQPNQGINFASHRIQLRQGRLCAHRDRQCKEPEDSRACRGECNAPGG